MCNWEQYPHSFPERQTELMTNTINDLGQPIGFPVVHWKAAVRPPREAMILTILLNHPELLARHAEEVAVLEFSGRDHLRLRNGLVALAAGPLAGGVAVPP